MGDLLYWAALVVVILWRPCRHTNLIIMAGHCFCRDCGRRFER